MSKEKLEFEGTPEHMAREIKREEIRANKKPSKILDQWLEVRHKIKSSTDGKGTGYVTLVQKTRTECGVFSAYSGTYGRGGKNQPTKEDLENHLKIQAKRGVRIDHVYPDGTKVTAPVAAK